MSVIGSKQSVYIVRYGKTKFNLVESVGPFDSDIDLTEGVEHAKCIASSIASEDAPSVVYSSPFQRCAHTAQLIALALPRPVVRIEEGLTEWLIPSLLVDASGVKTNPRSVRDLAVVYGTIDDDYESVNPVAPDDATDVPVGVPKFVESEEALIKRCAMTLQKILDHSNGASIALVSHAPCDQSLAFFLEGAASPAESKLGPWPLGGITKFSRSINKDGSYGEWVLEKYGDTAHMPGKYKPGIKHWSLPSFE
ncbi:26S Proteasome non-ATPase regulatory subunit [Fragilaria crotonensis]|nr:26S Proteasome non-ATPase regulatory subunit [Fragilaria crotonensis]